MNTQNAKKILAVWGVSSIVVIVFMSYFKVDPVLSFVVSFVVSFATLQVAQKKWPVFTIEEN